MADYIPAFRRCQTWSRRTVHAGEGRPVSEIRFAIEHLLAQRIGHGVSLLDDPALVERVVAQQIHFEACPTSNWQTGVIDSLEAHPLGQWIRYGVSVSINTDNTLLSQVDLPTELARSQTACQLSDAELEYTIQCGHRALFTR